jgi:26S proteasome non-ATPase regulatory subunit 5
VILTSDYFRNGTISFRVHDLIIKVATISDDTFSQCEASGLLEEFTKELQSDDLLLKINAIELLNEVIERNKKKEKKASIFS